ncbi:MAG: nucleotide exchange factor GrpE [Thermodesulfobacteriota bacterium]
MQVGDENDMDKELNQKDENTEDENSSEENNTENDINSNESGDLKNKYDDLYNRFIRLAADFDNYKKRISKEKQNISEYGNEELIRELLTVLDNLQLAVDHFDPEGDMNSLVEGVKLVQYQMVTALQKFGLQSIGSQKGTEFDPRLHQAVERIETSEITPGLILDELVRGYLINDRLLRPASVTVSTDIIKKKDSEINNENIDKNTEEVDEDKKADEEVKNKSGSGEKVFDLTDEDLE